MSQADQGNDRRFGRPASGARVAEMIVITPWVRFWRFVRLGIWLALLIVAFGLGVVAGTSGIYSDGLVELRRVAGAESGDADAIARAIDTLARLDASVDVDPARTRQGVAQSLADLGGLCEAGLDEVRGDINTRVSSGMMRVTQTLAASDANQAGGIEELRLRVAELDARSSSTEDFCAQTFALMRDILSVAPEASTESTPAE